LETIIKNKKSAAAISGLIRPKKLIAFGWYGGKFSHLDWLLPLLPHCQHFPKK
jgi:DNA adenine methylase